jgi:hypothetical protein
MYIDQCIPDLHGTVFPANPFNRELFYRDDLNQWFYWNGTAWVNMGGLGTIGTKNPPIDADKELYLDSTAGDAPVTSTWLQIKAFLKTYFDTVYGAIGLAHNRLHSIISPLDHTSAATPGRILQADANGLPVNATNTDADVADAVAKRHTQGTDTSLGAVGVKNPPIDADKVLYRDSTAGDALVTSTWTQIKAFLKTYWDTLYEALGSVATHAGLTTGIHGVGAGSVMGTTLAQTVTNKRNQPRISSTASGDISPDISAYDIYIRTAQAAGIAINNPVGSPAQGEKMIIRLKDNGTARAISWGGQYRGLEFALPATTVLSKLLYTGFIFNSDDTKWDMVAINEE